MPIVFHQESQEFHLYNEHLSYVMTVLPNGHLGNLYFGKRVQDKESFSYLFEVGGRALMAYVFEDNGSFALQHTRQEYPPYGTTDFRYPAYEVQQPNGSHISNFVYQSHQIFAGKKTLAELPSTYVENEDEATTLEVTLYDEVIDLRLVLSFTIYTDLAVITRQAKFTNLGQEQVSLERAMSFNLDLPDANYDFIHLDGSWSRERHISESRLTPGEHSIYSLRGASSAEHNPFIALKRPETTENQGAAYGFSLIYSGNFLGQVVVDPHETTRVMMGIHPDRFSWDLSENESFQTPEAVLVYADQGLNQLSQTFHELYRTRLARGYWRDRPRPILLNNWEATSFDFTEEKILAIADVAAEVGVELFVLDDGWFGKRNNDRMGLGDWTPNFDKLPDGIVGLAQKVTAKGLGFGLWFEPEMVNKDSDLYRAHPDWIIQTPDRSNSPSRNQHTLDLTREEVVEYLYQSLSDILRTAPISYVKWDMNRYMTEVYSPTFGPTQQGRVMHKYILNLYRLLERLTTEFPQVLFESCSSGGARFDPGMLYYMPQTWTSDNTDAIERLKIQYGTSMVYPLASMGSHVSESPNQQVGRSTPLETRANVAYFGTFGYELDATEFTAEEKEVVKAQVAFFKEYRQLIQQGKFHRLHNPFKENCAAWMVVADDQSKAVVAYYKILNGTNLGFKRLYLQGLAPTKRYRLSTDESAVYYGDELMSVGIVLRHHDFCHGGGDFSSAIYTLTALDD